MSRITGLPWPWSRPALYFLVGACIAMIAAFSSTSWSTHFLVVVLLIATVWFGFGLYDAIRVIHQALERRD
jgi:hypothetical protein